MHLATRIKIFGVADFIRLSQKCRFFALWFGSKLPFKWHVTQNYYDFDVSRYRAFKLKQRAFKWWCMKRWFLSKNNINTDCQLKNFISRFWKAQHLIFDLEVLFFNSQDSLVIADFSQRSSQFQCVAHMSNKSELMPNKMVALG